MSEETPTREDGSEDGVSAKEAAAANEPGLDDPSRSGATGADVGSGRPADAFSQQSVEEAARANAEPLDPATGTDATRDPSQDGNEDDGA